MVPFAGCIFQRKTCSKANSSSALGMAMYVVSPAGLANKNKRINPVPTVASKSLKIFSVPWDNL